MTLKIIWGNVIHGLMAPTSNENLQNNQSLNCQVFAAKASV